MNPVITQDEIQRQTEVLLANLGVQAEVKVLPAEAGFAVEITSPDSAILIGWRGGTLAALEYLVRLLLFKSDERTGRDVPDIHVDVEGYKQRQTAELAEVAQKTAEMVRTSGEAQILRPMTAFERRVVHVTLADFSDLTTESIGTPPNRRIMIKRKDR